jgi:hypothetical protein
VLKEAFWRIWFPLLLDCTPGLTLSSDSSLNSHNFALDLALDQVFELQKIVPDTKAKGDGAQESSRCRHIVAGRLHNLRNERSQKCASMRSLAVTPADFVAGSLAGVSFIGSVPCVRVASKSHSSRSALIRESQAA